MKREIIIHCFQWKLKSITENLDKIKESGYTSIQVSPVQGTKNNGNEFWLLYQPLDMSFVNSEQIGTKEDLIELCNEAHKRDLKICVDIILRHTAGSDTGELKPHEKVSKRLIDNPWFWTNSENVQDYTNRTEIYSKACGMPMLCYSNYDLHNIYNEFLDDLENMGVDFFRLDQLKHFQTPREGCEFLNRVFTHRNNKLTYGEALECSKELLDEFTQYMNVLSDSECSDKKKFVTYIENHDTYHTWGFTKKMNDDMLTNEWKYLLQSNKESHVIWFCRPWSNLWMSEQIKYINKEFK